MAVAIIASRRGAWGLGVFTLAVLACLIGLGVWQLQRKQEKVTLIAALTQRLAAAPVALPPPETWPSLTPARDEFRRVTLHATRDAAPPAFVFTSGSALRPDVSGIGTWVFAPLRTTAGQTVVVNLGFVPDGQTAASAATGAMTLTGYLRFPEQQGWFTPQPDLARRTWYARDPGAMAAALGWGEVAPFYLDLEAPAPAAGWPKPGPLAVHLRDQHLQYALTWFGLAAVVMVTFAVWLFGQRRA
jgi:cytochrome oxidase assembly protein ShyY1